MPYPEKTNANLSAKLKEREEKTFQAYRKSKWSDEKLEAELYALLFQHACRVCQRLLDSDVEDAAQEIVLKAFLNMPLFENESRFTTWFHKIALNHVRDALAKRKKLAAISLEGLPYGQEPAVDVAGEIEGQILVDEVLSRLSDEDKLRLELRMDEATFREIGEATGDNRNTARKKFTKLVEKISRRL